MSRGRARQVNYFCFCCRRHTTCWNYVSGSETAIWLRAGVIDTTQHTKKRESCLFEVPDEYLVANSDHLVKTLRHTPLVHPADIYLAALLQAAGIGTECSSEWFRMLTRPVCIASSFRNELLGSVNNHNEIFLVYHLHRIIILSRDIVYSGVLR